MNVSNGRGQPRGLCAAAVAAILATAAANAAEPSPSAPPASGGIEEIVVTAQKREQSLQDVGISMAAYSGEQLENLGISNTTQITQQVPALQLVTFTPALTIFSLRGISQNNFQDNLEAPVAVYFDDSYVASMNAINGQMFDMQRVEVLRGPQGTLFGRNATGGLIHFVSRRADDREFNGYAEIGAADFGTYSAQGAAGGELNSQLRGRIAGRYEKSDGYLKAGTAFGNPATGRTSQGANGVALRGALQFDPSDAVRVDLLARYARDHDVPTGQYVVTLAGFDAVTGLGRFTGAYNTNPADPNNPLGPTDYARTPITGDVHRHASSENPYFDRQTKALTAIVKGRIGTADLVSVTNWMQLDKNYVEDAGGGFGFFPYTTVANFNQWSQELRLTGESAGLRWQVGAYFLDMNIGTWQRIEGALALGGTSDAQKVTTEADIDSRNVSMFAQLEYDLTERLTLVGGLRWSSDRKRLDMRRQYEDLANGIAPSETYNIASSTVPGIDTIKYGDYAMRAQLNYSPAEDHLLYVAFNRGIKGGNWSVDPLGGVNEARLKHGEEVLNAYELGWKADFAGFARLNTAAFYYDYNDYQAFSLVGLVPQVTNSGADAKGLEMELALAPLEGLTVSLGATLMDSNVSSVPDVFGGTVSAEFPLAPKSSVNLLARYEWPAMAGTLAAQMDGQWSAAQYLEGTNSQVSRESAYSTWNLRLSWESADARLTTTLFARNLFDASYRLYNLDLGLLGFVEQAYAPPRQIGAAVSYRW